MPWKKSLPSWSLRANGSRQTADLNNTYMRHFPIMISNEKQMGQQKSKSWPRSLGQAVREGPFQRRVAAQTMGQRPSEAWREPRQRPGAERGGPGAWGMGLWERSPGICHWP